MLQKANVLLFALAKSFKNNRSQQVLFFFEFQTSSESLFVLVIFDREQIEEVIFSNFVK